MSRDRTTWRWTQEVKDLVAKHFPTRGAPETARIIRNITAEQVWSIAYKLGLTKSRQKGQKHTNMNRVRAYDHRPLQDALKHFPATLKPMDAEPLELR